MNEKIDKRIIKIQSDIQLKLNLDNEVTTHFFTSENLLEVYTYNSRHDTFFLLHSVRGPVDIRSWIRLRDNVYLMIDLLGGKELDDVELNVVGNSYTIKWKDISALSKNESYESHFYAEDVEDALNKFYKGKDKSNYEIFTINLNPIS